jgi:hypothetical protein
MPAKTRYAQYGDLNLAYQVVGDGEVDIVLVPSFVSHIEFYWAHPAIKTFLDRLTSFARLVIFDKAGTGLSDPVSGIPTLEQRAGEVEAVMDAAGQPCSACRREVPRRSSSRSPGRAARPPSSCSAPMPRVSEWGRKWTVPTRSAYAASWITCSMTGAKARR